MTTIINKGSGESSGAGLVIGVIIGVVLIALFFIFALPALRNNGAPAGGSANINVEIPGGSTAE